MTLYFFIFLKYLGNWQEKRGLQYIPLHQNLNYHGKDDHVLLSLLLSTYKKYQSLSSTSCVALYVFGTSPFLWPVGSSFLR